MALLLLLLLLLSLSLLLSFDIFRRSVPYYWLYLGLYEYTCVAAVFCFYGLIGSVFHLMALSNEYRSINVSRRKNNLSRCDIFGP